MKPVKRIDIVLPEAIVKPFIDLIEKHPFQAYSVNTGLSGKSRGGLATPGLCDATVTIICEPDGASGIIRDIGAFLDRYGGVGCVVEGQGLGLPHTR